MSHSNTFKKELEQLINKYSKENYSNTPDFILAEYLNNCLLVFNDIIIEREKWYGRLSEYYTSQNYNKPNTENKKIIETIKTQSLHEVNIHKVNNTKTKSFVKTLEQFYENTKVKSITEKIKALKWYLDIRIVNDCDTEEKELEFLENSFNKGS